MMRRSRSAALLALLAAIPTAMGYVVGPVTHAIDRIFDALGLPICAHLGYMWLPLVTIIARALIGRGAAIAEGLLLGITGVVFHPKVPHLTFARDLMLGVGVELATIHRWRLGTLDCLLAGVVGSLVSYTPYLLFIAPSPEAFMAVLGLMPSYLLSGVAGAYLAALIIPRVERSLPAGHAPPSQA